MGSLFTCLSGKLTPALYKVFTEIWGTEQIQDGLGDAELGTFLLVPPPIFFKTQTYKKNIARYKVDISHTNITQTDKF